MPVIKAKVYNNNSVDVVNIKLAYVQVFRNPIFFPSYARVRHIKTTYKKKQRQI